MIAPSRSLYPICLATIMLILLAPGLCMAREISGFFGEGSREAFKQAVELYRQGDYERALEGFQYLQVTYPMDRHYTGFMIMASKCQLRLRRYDAAENGLKELLERFLHSSYRGPAYILLGEVSFLKGEMLQSTLNYLRGFESARRRSHREYARKSFLPLLERHLTLEELDQLCQQYRGQLLGELFFYKGKRESDAGQWRRAIASLERFAALSPADAKRPEALKLLENARGKVSTRLTIGVLAPLSGDFADYGKSMLEGIRLALVESSNPSPEQVELTVKDNQGEAVATALATRELSSDVEVAAIIGPLRSETAVVAAVNADCYRLPVITPTASEAGISSFSDYVYQLSPSSETMARKLAAYAVNSLRIKEFAILAPNDSHGRKVSQVFARQVDEKGGRVLKDLYFTPGQTDFKESLGEIREMLIDKTKKLWEEGELDSSIFFNERGDSLPPEEWPVYLEGFFIPAYPEDLNLIVPQVAFSIIKTRLLGLEGWSDLEALKPSRDYLQEAVFCCHFVEDESDAGWLSFSKRYRSKYGENPDWVAAFSYDCADLVLKAFESGAYVPERVNQYLRGFSTYAGVTGKIEFDSSSGENQAVVIYEIRGSGLRRLK